MHEKDSCEQYSIVIWNYFLSELIYQGTVGTFISRGCNFSVTLNFHKIWWLIDLSMLKLSSMKQSAHFSVCWVFYKLHFCDSWLHFWTIFLHVWIWCKIKCYLLYKASKKAKRRKKNFWPPDPTSFFAQMIWNGLTP